MRLSEKRQRLGLLERSDQANCLKHCDPMPLLLIPHCDLDSECCGCFCEVVDADGRHFVCNECGAVLPTEQVAPLILAMESCEATCSHCGKMSQIDGFSEVFAFRFRFCGEGVTLS
jgi:hypothetical protein